jgi:hypothetical protein
MPIITADIKTYRIVCSLIAIGLGLIAQSPRVLAQSPNPPKVERASETIAGTYQLTGVMETASGLKNTPDGHYSWWLAVGGLDLYSEGQWSRQGNEIILGPHQFDKNMPPFELSANGPWTEKEKEAALNMEHIRLQNRAERVCPFLAYGATWGDADVTLPTNISTEQKFVEALKLEARLKTEYQAAITDFFEAGENLNDDQLEVAARIARTKWEAAADLVKKLAVQTGKTASITSPNLNTDCVLPAKPKTAANPSDWSSGTGVWIGNPDQPNARRDFEVNFHFADGSMVRGRSYELGFVFAPATAKKLNRLSFTLTHEGQKFSQAFEIKNDNINQVFYVRTDPRVTIKPPFEEMRLKIEKERLVSTSSLGINGTYIRTNEK